MCYLVLSYNAQAQIITTYAGTGSHGYTGDGGPATAARISSYDVAIDKHGNLFIADGGNNRVRKVTPNGIISTFAGTGVAGFSGDGGPATAAQLWQPIAIATDTVGNVYVADGQNVRIRKIDAAGTIHTIAGNGTPGYSGDGGPATSASMTPWHGLAVDKYGNVFFVNSHAMPPAMPEYVVRKIDASGIISKFAGDGTYGSFGGDGGPATSAQMHIPSGLAVDTNGNVYICDGANERVRFVNAATNIISTFAGDGSYGYTGDGGMATAAGLMAPYDVATDIAGNVYISDQNAGVVRKVDAAGVITTIAGSGIPGYGGDGGPATAAQLQTPTGLAIMGLDNLFIFDQSNHRVRVLNRQPSFIYGRDTAIAICMDTPAVHLDTFLTVNDDDKGMPMRWHIASGPFHGTASVMYNHPSVGDTVIPSGINYVPATGYLGMDTLHVRISDAIAADTLTFYFTVNSCLPDGVRNIAHITKGMALYPNPTANGRFTIRCTDGSHSGATVMIYDAMGRLMSKNTISPQAATNIQTDAPAGLYLVQLITEKGIYSTQLSILR